MRMLCFIDANGAVIAETMAPYYDLFLRRLLEYCDGLRSIHSSPDTEARSRVTAFLEGGRIGSVYVQVNSSTAP